MTADTSATDTVWQRVRERFPWPDRQPATPPIHWNLDYGGRGLIARTIRERRLKVVLEIGVFLGGSVRQWLAASPDVVVLAVDHWNLRPVKNNFVVQRAQQGPLQALLDPEQFYETFLATMWDARERVVPVRGDAVEMLYALRDLGLRPDLVYIDTDKTGREIAVCEELFPGVLIGGDDWYWGGDQGFPIRRSVREFCRAHDRHLKQAAMTWLIDDRPPRLGERVRDLYYLPHEIGLSCYGAYHWLRGKCLGEQARRNHA